MPTFLPTIVFGLLVFSVLVIFHEYGHFWMARRMGVRVERFSIGFGPVVFSRVHDGVEYAVSALPLGGYVKMGGDDPRNREALRPGDFFHAAWWRRVLIAVAGPAANFVFALVLAIVLSWVGMNFTDAPNRVGSVDDTAAAAGFTTGDEIIEVAGQPVAARSDFFTALEEADGAVEVAVLRDGAPVRFAVDPADAEALAQGLVFPLPAEIGDVVNGFPAYRAGLETGDRIAAIDGEPILAWSELTEVIHGSPDEELVLTVARGDRTFDVTLTPVPQSQGERTVGMIGISPAGGATVRVSFPGWEGVERGFDYTLFAVGATYKGIWQLVTDFRSTASQISGPVAIIEASGQAAQAGLDRLIGIAIALNVALMVFNLLPIPILDGGMIMLSAWEGLRQRPVGERGLAVYQGIGMAVIGTLLLFVLINDPLRMVQRQRAVDRIAETSP